MFDLETLYVALPLLIIGALILGFICGVQATKAADEGYDDDPRRVR